jgi:hypothetical protein
MRWVRSDRVGSDAQLLKIVGFKGFAAMVRSVIGAARGAGYW